jgi:hypothetical protein
MRQLLFSVTKEELNQISNDYKAKVPEPLNRKFTQRRNKGDAMVRYNERKEKVVTLFPTGKYNYTIK